MDFFGPLLSLSPNLFDQSFPRSDDELSRAMGCIIGILTLAENDAAKVALTEGIALWEEVFEWTERPQDQYRALSELHRALTQIFLQQGRISVSVQTGNVMVFSSHPLPMACGRTDLSEIWQEDMGRLFARHKEVASRNEEFIGIACEFLFSGEPSPGYPADAPAERFSLVGPNSVQNLSSAFDWHIDLDLRRQEVAYSDVMKNVHVVGGRIGPERGSSHRAISGDGWPRSWPLDSNLDPVPEPFLRTLGTAAGYPLLVLKHALLYGELPPRVLRI